MAEFLEANGTRLRVEEAGSGPDLLLIHAGVGARGTAHLSGLERPDAFKALLTPFLSLPAPGP